MAEMGLNQSQLAAKCGCSPRKINEIVNGKREISYLFRWTDLLGDGQGFGSSFLVISVARAAVIWGEFSRLGSHLETLLPTSSFATIISIRRRNYEL
jgi:hypothetical protein